MHNHPMTSQTERTPMLPRPEYQLDRLPLRFRWEVTRRHPVYLQLWQVTQSARSSGGQQLVDQIRRQPLYLNAAAAIRVFGELLDPSTGFDELAETIATALFQRGSLQPVDVKSIAGILMRTMSSQGLRRLANMMERYADGRDELAPADQVLDDLAEFLLSTDPELTAYLDAPFYSISPVAPREQVLSDVAAVQAEWRQRLELSEQRSRANDYPAYLEVWDRCEGFVRGQYERISVSSFIDVAVELGEPRTTIRNRYQRAFQIVTGHEYSLENWQAVMGVQQFGQEFGGVVSRVSHRRLRPRPSVPDVDFSTIVDNEATCDPAYLGSSSGNADHIDSANIVRRICEMIEQGSSDDQILGDVELGESAREAVSYLRLRDDIRAGFLESPEN